MDVLIILAISIIFYLIAGFMQVLNSLGYLRRSSKWWVLFFGFIAVCLHSMLLHEWIDIAAGQNLNFFNMLSLTIWLISVLILVVVLIKPVEVLFVFLFPAAVLSILLVFAFPTTYIVQTAASPDALFHILVSVFTFCVLCVAGLLAILLAIQERLLRFKSIGTMIQRLPPLESMETLLFQVNSLGFVLLSVVLVTSFYFYYPILFKHVVLLQKAITVIAAWVIFAVLLLGRYQWGWRGRKAIYSTLCGVLLLVVAYFTSKLALEALH